MFNQHTYSPFAVAKFFLQKAGRGDDLTPMKLIKLVYIAHGWHLGLLRKNLIAERAQAWQYGPVIPSLYDQYKRYGSSVIPGHEANELVTEIGQDDTETRAVLERVWERYSPYDGLQLSTLTHQEGSPWYRVWHEHGAKNKHNVPIPNDLIRQHYEQIIRSARENEQRRSGVPR